MERSDGETPIRLLLVEDHGLLRESLSRYLASQPDFDILGECGNSQDALELLGRSAPDIVLLGFELGDADGNEFMRLAAQAGFAGRFLLMAGAADPHSAALALKLGASGIFLKSAPLDQLVKALCMVADGQVWLDPAIVRTLADRLIERDPQFEGESGQPLPDREQRVLRGIMNGLTNRDIGARLKISESTVKNIVQRLFRRAGVKTRSQLVRAAMEGARSGERQPPAAVGR